MNTSIITKTFKKFTKFLVKNKTPILIASGICLSGGAIIETARVTPEAKRRIEVKKQLLKVDKLSPVETIKTAGPVYIPPLLMYGTAVTCIITGTSDALRQNTALATACAMSENALQEYKQSVVETVGDKKEKLIEEHLATKKVEQLPPAQPNLIVAGSGDVRCIDTFTDREFVSNASKIRQAISELNYDMTTQSSYISLNEYFDKMGIRQNDLGDTMGWNLNDGVLEVDFTSALSTDGVPCLAVTIDPLPHQNYLNY